MFGRFKKEKKDDKKIEVSEEKVKNLIPRLKDPSGLPVHTTMHKLKTRRHTFQGISVQSLR